jgi:hypothetical protein
MERERNVCTYECIYICIYTCICKQFCSLPFTAVVATLRHVRCFKYNDSTAAHSDLKVAFFSTLQIVIIMMMFT